MVFKRITEKSDVDKLIDELKRLERPVMYISLPTGRVKIESMGEKFRYKEFSSSNPMKNSERMLTQEEVKEKIFENRFYINSELEEL